MGNKYKREENINMDREIDFEDLDRTDGESDQCRPCVMPSGS